MVYHSSNTIFVNIVDSVAVEGPQGGSHFPPQQNRGVPPPSPPFVDIHVSLQPALPSTFQRCQDRSLPS